MWGWSDSGANKVSLILGTGCGTVLPSYQSVREHLDDQLKIWCIKQRKFILIQRVEMCCKWRQANPAGIHLTVSCCIRKGRRLERYEQKKYNDKLQMEMRRKAQQKDGGKKKNNSSVFVTLHGETQGLWDCCLSSPQACHFFLYIGMPKYDERLARVAVTWHLTP